ncbi:MAG: hypothetical protein ACK4TR_15620 [Phenylobacterium sp.]|uniref:hypothetical protein n=1 Tax=Phenylobacterium sp. TaxID=1871053 RepID=UPI00391BD2F8
MTAISRSLEYRACASGELVGPPDPDASWVRALAVSLANWAERYQTLLGAILGFGGIIVTLLENAKLARRQGAMVRAQETEGLRAALKGELAVLADTFSNALETIKRARTDKTRELLVPTVNTTAIFDASTSKLGLLTIDQTSAVVRTYSLVKELPIRIGVLRQMLDSDSGRTYAAVGSPLFGALERLYAMALQEVQVAAQALE